MRLEIGPFPAAGGEDWIAQARKLVRFLRAGAPMPFAVLTVRYGRRPIVASGRRTKPSGPALCGPSTPPRVRQIL